MIHMRLSIKDGMPAFIDIPLQYQSMLAIGSIGCVYNTDALIYSRVTHLVSLCDNSKWDDNIEFIKFYRLIISDSVETNILDSIDECCRIWEECCLTSGRLVITCFQGKSRSAAICCGIMIKKLRFSYEEAIDRVKRVRPIAEPNTGFVHQLKLLASSLSS